MTQPGEKDPDALSLISMQVSLNAATCLSGENYLPMDGSFSSFSIIIISNFAYYSMISFGCIGSKSSVSDEMLLKLSFSFSFSFSKSFYVSLYINLDSESAIIFSASSLIFAFTIAKASMKDSVSYTHLTLPTKA